MTPNTQALQRLLDKVESGKVSQWFNWNSGIGSHGPLARQAYNGSLDAAKALHDALLPGWIWQAGTGIKPVSSYATIYPPGDFLNQHVGYNADPARAWLLAIIRAVMAGER